MDWKDIVELPAFPTVAVGLLSFAGGIASGLLGRKSRVDRMREAMNEFADLLAKVPKGGKARPIIEEAIDHTARHMAIRQRRGSYRYFYGLTLILLLNLYWWGFVAVMLHSRRTWVLFGILVAGYAVGRLQAFVVAKVDAEYRAAGFPVRETDQERAFGRLIQRLTRLRLRR